ncbi:unnamed protein product, partial [Mesorhabditis belari]|uniref:Uncharacterized protein n=1 Tax=Mesorhabditis belari TaxID=2138241 RepID=A0AAF3EVY5_9BILA
MRMSRLHFMKNLVARFCPVGNLHVIDPQVDLKHIFANPALLQRDLAARELNIDASKVQTAYEEWWKLYEQFNRLEQKDAKTAAYEAKKEMKLSYEGLLDALALPNKLSNETLKQRSIKKDPLGYHSNHFRYLAKQGLLSTNRTTETVNLIGYLPLMLKAIRKAVIDLFSEMIPISPPHLVRAALLEGCNVDLAAYSQFNEGKNTSDSKDSSFLVGHSLTTTLAPFIRTVFSKHTNCWPICLHSSGMAYFAKSNRLDLISCRQREQYVQLVMGTSKEEVQTRLMETVKTIERFLRHDLQLQIYRRNLSAPELMLSESSGVVVEDDDVQLIRSSFYGEYVSRRLNLQFTDGFLQLGFVTVDLYRVLAKIIDATIVGNDLPPILRSTIKKSRESTKNF